MGHPQIFRIVTKIFRIIQRQKGSKMPITADEVEVHEVEGSEGKDIFDSVCRYYLDMSGPEFLAKWDQGLITYADAENDSRISRVVSTLPFAA
jgi:hypothetical protein